MIERRDGSYAEESTYCDGANSAVVDARECIIPLLTLQASPFLLELGDEVRVTVSATNEYGESD